jgi:hypothetical protein
VPRSVSDRAMSWMSIIDPRPEPSAAYGQLLQLQPSAASTIGRHWARRADRAQCLDEERVDQDRSRRSRLALGGQRRSWLEPVVSGDDEDQGKKVGLMKLRKRQNRSLIFSPTTASGSPKMPCAIRTPR